MFSELTSILRTLGYSVYDTDVPEASPKLPYILVWGGDSSPHPEQSVASQADGVSDRVGVTVTAGTPAGARQLHRLVREVLQPGGFPREIGGFHVKIRDHQPVQIDRDVTLASTGRHPAYCVDIYSVQR